MMKRNPKQSELSRDDLIHFCKKIAQLSEIYISDFYALSGIDSHEYISKSKFVVLYHQTKNLKLLKFFNEIIIGYS